jgi:hypothetical protein
MANDGSKNADLNGKEDQLQGRNISVRPLSIPKPAIDAPQFQSEPLSEIRIEKPGTLPFHAVVPSSSLNSELINEFEKQVRDLPRLELGGDLGAN